MMKRKLTTFLTLIFIVAIVVSLSVVLKHISDESRGESSTSLSEGSTSESSTPADNSSVPDDDSSADSTEPPVLKDSVVSFLAAPDNLIHPSVHYDGMQRAAELSGKTPNYKDKNNAEYLFAPMYENLVADIKKADLAYINIESLIGGNQNKIWSGNVDGGLIYTSAEAVGYTLLDIGFNVFNLAHNHMLDGGKGDQYLAFSDQFFRSKGGTPLGYYKDEADTENFPIIEKNGIKIALLTYTYGTNGMRLQNGSKTVIPYLNEAFIRKQVPLAKSKADVVIVSAHWGVENTFNVNNQQKTFAQLFVDLGVDVVVGMHPHSLQPMKWVENADGHKTLLTYSLGNFLSGMQNGTNVLGGLLSFDIVKSAADGNVSIQNVQLKPFVNHYVKERSVGADDTGFRKFKLYYLEDYTQELAAAHGVHIFEKSNRPTLEGGKFSLDTLKQSVKKCIPAEFLSEFYQ